MSISFRIMSFKELSVEDLYNLLKLRAEVFVVEQNCVYQDLDGKDQKAFHVIGYFEGNIVAYTRIFKKGDYFFDGASIGRVVVDKEFRDRKWGHDLIKESIKAIEEKFVDKTIVISAQEYLLKFYESHGFIKEGEIYLEDGIPHLQMRRLS